MLIREYGERRLQELGAHKRRKLRPHQPGVADAARIISDVMQPTCDVIPADTTPGGDADCDDGGASSSRAGSNALRPLSNTRTNGNAVSHLPLNDLRGKVQPPLLILCVFSGLLK